MELPSLIFIDGGDPAETAKAKSLLGHIDGQTTNPTLVSKNPDVVKYLTSGKRLTQAEALREYKKIIESIAKVTTGPISIQVLADQTTSKDDMLAQAKILRSWIPNGVVKFPCTGEGLAAAEVFCQEWSVNITLNFSQDQAAAVYAATRNHTHKVFVSPFIGRLDDRGENGMQVVENILDMYQTISLQSTPPHPLFERGGMGELQKKSQGELRSHVEVLTASLRKLDHLLYALQLKSPAITVPFKIFQEWAEKEFPLPDSNFRYDPGTLTPIPYHEIPLDMDWREYDLRHDLTDKGLTKFMEDWQSIIK